MTELLREVPRVRQIKGEPRRRWFSSETVDLIIWYNPLKKPIGFQLCYRTGASEHALTWRAGKGLDHASVDSGESGRVGYKRTPILRPNGAYNPELLKERFENIAAEVPPLVRRMVVEALVPAKSFRK